MTIEAPFCLASASPRRRELLAQLGLQPMIVPGEIDESVHAGEQPEVYVRRMATEKARSGRRQMASTNARIPVMAADTTVIIDNKILGKPRNKQDAIRMLKMLSGAEHRVLSAVAMAGKDDVSVLVNTTRVWFRFLSEAEIEAYWYSGEPKDKAGAYAIQGLGAAFVSSIHGSYSGVMGLPLFETLQLLADHGIDVLANQQLSSCSGAD